MIVYRICNTLYKDDISGYGASVRGARWNAPGTSMLYTSEHISLCALEMLVNIILTEVKINFHLLQISVPENASLSLVTAQKLKQNWRDDEGYTNFIGNEFCKNKDSLLLKVPSAVISEEYNYLINPTHPDFKKIKILNSKPFIFDQRLFSF
jgi:RES domain-containing protein